MLRAYPACIHGCKPRGYLILKLGETLTNPNRHNELSPPSADKLRQWLVWTGLSMTLLVGISAAGMWREQVWAQVLGSYILFFAINSFAGYLTIKFCNRWQRNHPLFIVGLHIIAFLIQVSLHLLILAVSLFCFAAVL